MLKGNTTTKKSESYNNKGKRPSRSTKNQDAGGFAQNLAGYLAFNHPKSALRGQNGVINQDKFNMIFEEFQKQ